jgi:O-antigen/teichoic acid export membrane protein
MLKKPLWNTAVQIVGKVLMTLISLVTTAILTRRLGTDIYGAFVLTTSVFLLLDALADFGSRAIGVREASKNPDKEAQIFEELAGLRLVMANVGFILGLVIIFTFKGFETIRLEAVISLLMIFFTSVAGTLEMVFQTRMRLDLKTVMDIVFPLSFLLVVWKFPFNLTLLWVMIFYLIARILSLLVGQKLAKWVLRFRISRVLYWLKELWPMGIYLIIFTAYDRAIDSMMISRFLGLKEVAWYGLSYKIYNSLVQPAYFFVASIFPLLSASAERKKLFFRSLILVLGVLLVASPILLALSPFMIDVFGGEDFTPSVLVLRILILAMIFAYVNHLLGFTIIAKRGQKSILLIGLVALVFNIAGNMYAIPRFGITGAAVVTVYTEILSAAFLGVSLWRSSLPASR